MLEVQGENVRLELEGSFNWGKPSVTVRAVRYTFPHIHAALEGLLGTSASDTSIAVSGTQVLTVQCADETRYYRDGQRVERFILKKEDGTQTYVYESEDVVTQEQGVFEKGCLWTLKPSTGSTSGTSACFCRGLPAAKRWPRS